MRRLCLLRHGKSRWDDASLADVDRPLSKRGRRAVERVARYLGATGVRPAIVLCSVARRTRETLDRLAPVLEGVPVAIETELYEADEADLLARLRRMDDRLASALLIGHNPGLERLAASLAAGHGDRAGMARMREKYPTGALAILECDVGRWADLGDGTCRLVSFVRPADLDDETNATGMSGE